MSFAEKVHNRLLALERQVVSLSQQIGRLDQQVNKYEPIPYGGGPEKPLELPVVSLPMKLSTEPFGKGVDSEPRDVVLKRKPGRPKKVVNG